MKYKDKDFFIITGLARSGTTFLSNLLDSHPNCFCASDPINVFFKAYICELKYHLTGEKVEVDKMSMPNGFMDTALTDLLKLQNLNLEIFPQHFKPYLDAITSNSKNFTPEIAKEIGKIDECKTFQELFEKLIECVYSCADPKAVVVGIKTAWSESMMPVLVNTYPTLKVVHIIRDPRAVIASNYATGTFRYPLLYNIRDWRKTIYYNFYLEKKMGRNYKFIRYEDLINKRLMLQSELFSFLHLNTEQELKEVINTNSSYSEGVESKLDYLNRWKTELPTDIVQYINKTCYLEMKKVGYIEEKPVLAIEDLDGYVEFSSLSGWCREDFQNEPQLYRAWIALHNKLERLRIEIGFCADNIYSDVAPAMFFDLSYFGWLQGSESIKF